MYRGVDRAVDGFDRAVTWVDRKVDRVAEVDRTVPGVDRKVAVHPISAMMKKIIYSFGTVWS